MRIFALTAVIAYLDSVKSHFERTEPKTKSPIDGLQVTGHKTLKYSLGTRMLQVAGLVEGPFKSEEKFLSLNLLYRNRLDAGGRLKKDKERDFRSDCKRLMRLVIGMAGHHCFLPLQQSLSPLYIIVCIPLLWRLRRLR